MNGKIFPRISSRRVTGVTWSCSSVPRSRSRTIAIAVNWMRVKVRMIAMSPGMMNVSVLRSALYQGLTRMSTGRLSLFQPALRARYCTESPCEIPRAIAIACVEVVVSEALTIRRARAGSPRWLSRAKFRSIARPTAARAVSIAWRSSSYEAT